MASPHITLGGRDFPVPQLAFRQIRLVTPPAQRLNAIKLTDLSEQDLNDLMEIAFVGAQKGTPELTRDQLEDMPITVDELLAAKRVVCEQAGMVAIQVGEPQAGT